ncbi:MAG: Thermostable carboxypeptidase 1 [Candidatus Carbobacillus altaicus]|uniref:Metal-dependent carboxypeptidase n=1 Tax=Candidatus Carbonibacillus altaicus TaxID=2163959 RepID=A0A2R6Y4J7_9BACL|nr:MAG: Thermostable carboxypeptidase 1 [Candidatus Carbobacillus altaicus]
MTVEKKEFAVDAAYETHWTKLTQTATKLQYYSMIGSLSGWDMQTMMPDGAFEKRAEAAGFLAGETHRLMTDPRLEEAVEALMEGAEAGHLGEREARSVALFDRNLKKIKNIPEERYRAYFTLTARGESVWRRAREANDFSSFAPLLEEIVAMSREFIDYLGYEEHPYDALLDDYEPGLTVKRIDQLFPALREGLIQLMKKIEASPHKPDLNRVRGTFPEAQQKKISRTVSERLGFDYHKGRLDKSAHPFTVGLHPTDVRITTRYFATDPFSSLYSTVHEAGHGMYEQNLPLELEPYPGLMAPVSMGVHESQSRFFENVIGRSYGFWQYVLPLYQEAFPDVFGKLDAEEVFRLVNASRPSLIRVEADEVTYNLHIMLRYELEKSLMSGEIKVRDLPELWREKMDAYLGIRPKTDAEGVLQDVHWSSGLFGYFPSYTLGNIYASQLYAALRKDIPDLEERLSSGDWEGPLHWMKSHIHRYGSLLDPLPLIERASGAPLSIEPLLNYLEEKMARVYRF